MICDLVVWKIIVSTKRTQIAVAAAIAAAVAAVVVAAVAAVVVAAVAADVFAVGFGEEA